MASAMWLGRKGEPPNQVQLAAQADTVIPAGAAATQRAIVAVETADAAFFEPADEAQLVGLLQQLAGEIR